MECHYCQKVFGTKGNLKTHQETARYCLSSRSSINEKFKCNYCDKLLSSKQILELHMEKCAGKVIYDEKDIQIKSLQIILKDKDEQIKEYRDHIKGLLSQLKELTTHAIENPGNISYVQNNKTIQSNSIKNVENMTLNMVPMNISQENLVKVIEEKFTETHLLKGQQGLAKFMIDNVLITPDKKYLMKCTDPSRRIFIYLDDNGNIVKDVNANNLTEIISKPLIETSGKIFLSIEEKAYDKDNKDEAKDYRYKMAHDGFTQIKEINSSNSEFVKNLIPPLFS
jgi:hypothetical protein